MKKLLQHVTASTLLLVLAVSTFAGDISTTVVPQPTPPAVAAEGQITTGAAGQIAQASDSIIEIALSLMQGVLSLF